MWPQVCTKAEGIHTMKGIEDLIKDEIAKEMDLFNRPPSRWVLIPDFSENKSYMLFIAHHSFIDGVQGLALLQATTVEKDFSMLPRVSPPSFWQNVMGKLLTPLATL